MSERNITLLLNDITDAIQNILQFTKGISFETYSSDIKTRHAVEHNFMIIGEAVARLPDDFKQSYTTINWRLIKDFRNVMVHDYFGIDNTIVWDIIQLNLADLASDIEDIKKKV